MMQRILYIQYTNPAALPPLEHSSRILARAGWWVLFLGISNPEADALSFPPHPNISVRQLPFCPAGWRQKIHYLWFCLWAMYWVLRWRPQWIYASNPLACPIAAFLTFFPGYRVIYHEHDSPNPKNKRIVAQHQSEARMGSYKKLFVQLPLLARGVLAARASLCILPNEQRAKWFFPETKKRKVLCVWNCPTQEEVYPVRPPSHRDTLGVLYQGSIGPDRLPSTILRALAMLPDPVKLYVIGIGHSNEYLLQLKTLARQLALHGRFEVIGPMARKAVLESSRRFDVGISLAPKHAEDINLQTMIGASNKTFDYLACGIALLVSNLPDWKKTYVDSGYGLACDPDDPESIAKALRWFLEHPKEMRAMGERGRQRILQEWNYERQFAPVLARLNGTGQPT